MTIDDLNILKKILGKARIDLELFTKHYADEHKELQDLRFAKHAFYGQQCCVGDVLVPNAVPYLLIQAETIIDKQIEKLMHEITVNARGAI